MTVKKKAKLLKIYIVLGFLLLVFYFFVKYKKNSRPSEKVLTSGIGNLAVNVPDKYAIMMMDDPPVFPELVSGVNVQIPESTAPLPILVPAETRDNQLPSYISPQQNRQLVDQGIEYSDINTAIPQTDITVPQAPMEPDLPLGAGNLKLGDEKDEIIDDLIFTPKNIAHSNEAATKIQKISRGRAARKENKRLKEIERAKERSRQRKEKRERELLSQAEEKAKFEKERIEEEKKEIEKIEAKRIEEAKIAEEKAKFAAEEVRLVEEKIAEIQASKAIKAIREAEKVRKKSKLFGFLDKLRNSRIEKIKEIERLKFFGYISVDKSSTLQHFYLYEVEDLKKYNIDKKMFKGVPYAHLMPLIHFRDIARDLYKQQVEEGEQETEIHEEIFYKMTENGINEGSMVSKLSPSMLNLVLQYVENGYLDFTHNCMKKTRPNLISLYYTPWYSQIGGKPRPQYQDTCKNQIFMDLVDLGYAYAKSKIKPKDFREKLQRIEDNGFKLPTLKDCFVYRYNDVNTVTNDGKSVYQSLALSTSFEDSSTFSRGSNPMRIYIPQKTPVKAFPIFLFGDQKEEYEVILIDVTIMRDKYYDNEFLNYIKDTETTSYVRGEEFQNWVAISRNISENLFKPTIQHTKLNFA